MRKIIFIIAFAFLGISVFSQNLQPSQVPTIVKNAVLRAFPQTQDLPVSWSQDQKNYKASMTLMDTPAFMVIDTLGRMVRIERRINQTYLPQKAKDQLKKLDPTYQIVSIMQITDSKEKVTYKTVAKISRDFTFDGEGNNIGKK